MITVQSTFTGPQVPLGQQRHHGPQQLDRVRPPPALVGVGEVLADVAHARGPQQRVGDGVGQHVGVGVTLQAAIVLDLHAPEHQRATLHQAVTVIADADQRQG